MAPRNAGQVTIQNTALQVYEVIIGSEFLIAIVNDASRAALVVIGLVAFSGGVLLMIRHKRDIDAIHETETDQRVLRFEQRKFRRRSLASTMIASLGVLMTSLYWARDPAVFVGLLSVILILLLAVLFLAFLDLMSVRLHSVTRDDQVARKKMVEEYLRQRKKLIDQETSNETEDSVPDQPR